MSGRWIAAVALTLALAAPAVVAHDGHVHTVMGTVMSRDASRFELKTASGEILSIAVNARTVVTRAKKKAPLTDLQKGVRVVVDIGNGEDPLVARGIQLGTTSVK